MQTGDQVTYNPGSTTPGISFLQGGVSYTGPLYARVLGTGLVQLYSSESDAAAGGSSGLVNFSYADAATGVAGAQQTFTFSPAIHFNPQSTSSTAPGAVDLTADTIFVGANSGLTTGEAVTYDSEGNTADRRPDERSAILRQVQSGGTVRLYTSQAAALAGATPDTVQFNPGSATNVDIAANAIIVGTNGGLVSGQQVTYDAEGNTPIGGLTWSQQLLRQCSERRRYDQQRHLRRSRLGSRDRRGGHLQRRRQLHAVGGLTSGGTYYVNVQGNGTIKLYNSAADANAGNGNFVVLSTTGGGSQQEFTFGSAQSVAFNPTAVALRLYTDAADAITGGATNLVTLASLGGGTQNRLIATNTGLVIFGAGGTGADQKFVVGSAVNSIAFNPTGTTIHREPIVNTTINSGSNPLGSTIYVGFTSGLQTGDAVTYTPGAGNAAIDPLVSGGSYYVNVQSNGTILLYDTEADALAGGAAGLQSLDLDRQRDGANPGLQPVGPFQPECSERHQSRTQTRIFLPPGNGLVTGDEVQYDTEGTAASFGLTNGANYYVNVQSDGAVALYATLAEAMAGGSAGLQALSATTGAGADQKFIVVSTSDKVTFNPTGTTNFIYTPTQQQVEALTAGIKEWTPNELLYGIGEGLLTNSVTDTVVNVQTTPDIAGAHVTLLTRGSVGQNSGTLEIPVVPGGTYSTQDLLALATRNGPTCNSSARRRRTRRSISPATRSP